MGYEKGNQKGIMMKTMNLLGEKGWLQDYKNELKKTKTVYRD